MASPTPANLRLRMTLQLSDEIRGQRGVSEGDALQAAATISSGMSLNEIRISLGVWPNTVDAAAT
ncbi:MAG: hypothetical protein OXI41_01700 [Chloroflexota bacterium]|nr:hypothetical protein [Chloroflexota bacterium]MDE2894208.1 hypothetical protein [Chloroflexota bacterium]